MNLKKILIHLLVILAAFILFIIWHKKNFEAVSTTALDRYKIYLITMDKQDQFWYTLDSGAKDMASLLGVTYQWEAPEEKNVEEQIDIVNEAVAAGADAIMLAVNDPIRLSPVVEDAKAKGVKIIYVDAAANEEGVITLATDNYAAGRIAGEAMLEELNGVGISSGSIGIIGVTPETITTVNRERGFSDVIQENGKFRLLDIKYAQGDPTSSQAAAQEYMNENEDLVGLFATNEGSTIGIGNAIQRSDTRIIGIGFDITQEIEDMIHNNVLQAVMAQNPYTMGYLGMAETVAALRGLETGPSFINTGISVVTKFSPRRFPAR